MVTPPTVNGYYFLGHNVTGSAAVAPTATLSTGLPAGFAFGSVDTGTPAITFGTNAITLSKPLQNTNAVLTTPNLGTPSAITLTNASGFPAAIVQTGQTNTYSTGDQDFHSATSMELPNTQAGAATTSTTDQGGQDVTGAATGTQGGKTIRGADISNAAGSASNVAGSVTIRGGDNANLGTGGVEAGGALTIRPGATTDGASGTDSIPGYLVISQTYRKGTTYTAAGSPTGGLLGTITGHNTVSDISANPYNWLGVNLPAINTTGANEQMQGIVTVRAHASTAFVNGDIVCTDTTNYGYVIDSGTAPCACPSTQVGMVDLSQTATTSLITLSHQGMCVPTVGVQANQFVDYIDTTTGVPHQRAIASGDVPSNAANTTGTASNLTAGSTPALPNGTTATTQTAHSADNKVATDAM